MSKALIREIFNIKGSYSPYFEFSVGLELSDSAFFFFDSMKGNMLFLASKILHLRLAFDFSLVWVPNFDPASYIF